VVGEPLQVQRQLLGVAEAGGSLFAVGGQDSGFPSLDTVEEYVPGRPLSVFVRD
jgi:hypothetical protein